MPAAESSFALLVGKVAWLLHVFGGVEATLKFDVVDGGNAPNDGLVIERSVALAWTFELLTLLTVPL